MYNYQSLRVSHGEEQMKGLEIDAPTPRPDPKPVPPYTGKKYPFFHLQKCPSFHHKIFLKYYF